MVICDNTLIVLINCSIGFKIPVEPFPCLFDTMHHQYNFYFSPYVLLDPDPTLPIAFSLTLHTESVSETIKVRGLLPHNVFIKM